MEQQPGAPVYQEPGRGTAILVLGILSLVCLALFTGIPAWIMGHGDLKKINRGVIPAAEKGKTKAGMILGIIGTIVPTLSVIIFFIVGVAFISSQGDDFKSGLERVGLYAFGASLGIEAQEYHDKNNTFEGFEIPYDYTNQELGSFEITSVETNLLKIRCLGNSVGKDGINPMEIIYEITPKKVKKEEIN